jgi:starch phosphorylase
MQPIRTFNISPSLPARLESLRRLAYNLHWDWNVETKDLFRRLDPDRWESSHHNPVLMLGTINQARLQEAAEDEGFSSNGQGSPPGRRLLERAHLVSQE